MPKKSCHTKTKKANFHIHNWSAYNESLVKRGSISLWISDDVLTNWHPEPGEQRSCGGQVRYSDQAIARLLTLKAVYGLAYRQTVGFGQSVLDLLGAEVIVPDNTTLRLM